MVFGSAKDMLMPYWMMLVLATTKPVVTLGLLGPPAVRRKPQNGDLAEVVESLEAAGVDTAPDAERSGDADPFVPQAALKRGTTGFVAEAVVDQDGSTIVAVVVDFGGSPRRFEGEEEMRKLIFKEPGCLAFLKREAPGALFLLLAVAGLASLGYKCALVARAGSSLSLQTAERLLAPLCNAAGVSSMLNVVALVGLYSEDGDATLNMLMGRRSEGNPFRKGGPVHKAGERWGETLKQRCPCCLGELAGLICILPNGLLSIVFGGLWGSLDRGAVAAMPSLAQRWLAVVLWRAYKPLYHVLLVLAAPALLAYAWASLLALFLCAIWSGMMTDFVLHPLLSLRARALGAEPPPPVSDNRRSAWMMYFVTPMLLGLLLPVGVPVSFRLLTGEGYWGAVAATWGDRHAGSYLGALLSSANATVTASLDRACQVTTLVQAAL